MKWADHCMEMCLVWTCKMLVRQWMKEIDKSLWGELESEEEEEEVLGKKGMLVCENPRVDAVHCYDTEGSASSPLFYSFPQCYELAYHHELDHFNVLHPSQCLLVNQVTDSTCQPSG